MRKRRFPVALLLGILLIAASITILLIQQIRAHRGAEKSQSIVEQMREVLPDRTVGIPDLYASPQMPTLTIDGRDYVALLEIPLLDVSLPVADDWRNDKLFEASARFCGSAYHHTLVIGGIDSSHQFEFCHHIDIDTVIVVTDMTGAQFTYTVKTVERSKTAESAWLADETYDLTLFCRDTYSMEYIAVRCEFSYR